MKVFSRYFATVMVWFAAILAGVVALATSIMEQHYEVYELQPCVEIYNLALVFLGLWPDWLLSRDR